MSNEFRMWLSNGFIMAYLTLYLLIRIYAFPIFLFSLSEVGCCFVYNSVFGVHVVKCRIKQSSILKSVVYITINEGTLLDQG